MPVALGNQVGHGGGVYNDLYFAPGPAGFAGAVVGVGRHDINVLIRILGQE